MAREVFRDGKPPVEPRESRCPACGTPFHCGVDDPGGCWCAKVPPLPREAYIADGRCLCEKCLRAARA